MNKKYIKFKQDVFKLLDLHNTYSEKINVAWEKVRKKYNKKYSGIETYKNKAALDFWDALVKENINPLEEKQLEVSKKCIILIGTCNGEVVNVQTMFNMIELICIKINEKE
jgi:hypothetical protein